MPILVASSCLRPIRLKARSWDWGSLVLRTPSKEEGGLGTRLEIETTIWCVFYSDNMSLILSQIECMKMKTKSGRLCLQYLLTRRVTVWSALVILLGTVVLVANICLVYNIRSGWVLHSNRHEERSQQQSPPSPTLWIYHKTVSLALVHLNIEAILSKGE